MIHVTFPTQYVPELAGKDATFHVKAHRIVRRSLPELNGRHFAQEQGFSDATCPICAAAIMAQAVLQSKRGLGLATPSPRP